MESAGVSLENLENRPEEVEEIKQLNEIAQKIVVDPETVFEVVERAAILTAILKLPRVEEPLIPLILRECPPTPMITVLSRENIGKGKLAKIKATVFARLSGNNYLISDDTACTVLVTKYPLERGDKIEAVVRIGKVLFANYIKKLCKQNTSVEARAISLRERSVRVKIVINSKELWGTVPIKAIFSEEELEQFSKLSEDLKRTVIKIRLNKLLLEGSQ